MLAVLATLQLLHAVDAAAAPLAPGLPVVMKADEQNGYLKHIPEAPAALRIERVLDRRGVAGESLGTTRFEDDEKGMERRLVFGESLAGFLQRVFRTIGARNPGDQPAVRLEVAIERFDLATDPVRPLADATVRCHALLSVAVLTDSGAVPVGLLQHEASEPISDTMLAAQEEATYRTIATFGQALAHDELGARDVAGGNDAPRRTVSVDYRGPEPTYQRSRHELLVGGVGFRNGDMRDQYGGGFALTLGRAGWSAGRRGVRLASAILVARSSAPRPADPTWTVESSSRGLIALPWAASVLHGFTDRSHASVLRPYVGVGGLLVTGIEWLKVKARRVTALGSESVGDSKIEARVAIGAQAIGGTELRLSPSMVGVLEGGWTQSTSGLSMGESQGDDVYRVLKRPKFNFTGWHIALGLRWYS
jgi:hypothetical protein